MIRRGVTAAVLAAVAVATLTGCPNDAEGTATCQAARKQAADDPGNPVKAQRARDVCS